MFSSQYLVKKKHRPIIINTKSTLNLFLLFSYEQNQEKINKSRKASNSNKHTMNALKNMKICFSHMRAAH